MRMFLLKLSLVTGWTMEYIENLPESLIMEYMALNSLSPFTHDAQANRNGFLAAMLWNKDVSKKKDMKSAADIFPYLKPGTPEWLEDERVRKAKSLLKSAELHLTYGKDIYLSNVSYIKEKIIEEIKIEENKKNKADKYLIKELKKLL